MRARKSKAGFFVLEGINAFATTYYFYYLFFFLKTEFGFSNLANLSVSALSGLVYTGAAWYGGRFAQRRGYFLALKTGFSILAVSLLIGSLASDAIVQVVIMVSCTLGMCFTWPTLEALASEKESPSSLPRMVGIYNLVWSGGSALAYFTGGALFEGLGARSLFLVPAGLHVTQLVLTLWLERRATRADGGGAIAASAGSPAGPAGMNPRPIAKVKSFQRMAWVANPFAYVAISTVVPLIPDLAQRLELAPTEAGFFCSVWLFARMGAFVWLWLWPGWHYRFDYLAVSFVALIASFVTILVSDGVGVILAAQVLFGLSLGLIYYSSLFYSMDASDTQGEHGGIHEAAIGAGIFLGPAIGAAALYAAPGVANGAAWAVGALLAAGLGAIGLMRRRA